MKKLELESGLATRLTGTLYRGARLGLFFFFFAVLAGLLRGTFPWKDPPSVMAVNVLKGLGFLLFLGIFLEGVSTMLYGVRKKRLNTQRKGGMK